MSDIPWGEIAKAGAGVLGTLSANKATQDAYSNVLRELRERFGDYESLPTPDYKEIVAPQLGKSALSGIADDPQARLDQQQAIGKLDDLAAMGGLTLEDKAALNQIERILNRNATARRKGIENQFAARGQMGAGAQLAMELDAAQNAAENANSRGEGIAAQAQKRAMDAVLKKGEMARAMSNDDYARKRAAAEAEDAIAKYNASMSVDATKANNSYAGQSYDDELKKLGAETGLTGSMNSATLGSGHQQANTNAGLAYGAANLADSFGRDRSGKATDPSVPPPPDYQDPYSDRWTDFPSADERGDRGGAADLGVAGQFGEDPTYSDTWTKWNDEPEAEK